MVPVSKSTEKKRGNLTYKKLQSQEQTKTKRDKGPIT